MARNKSIYEFLKYLFRIERIKELKNSKNIFQKIYKIIYKFMLTFSKYNNNSIENALRILSAK